MNAPATLRHAYPGFGDYRAPLPPDFDIRFGHPMLDKCRILAPLMGRTWGSDQPAPTDHTNAAYNDIYHSAPQFLFLYEGSNSSSYAPRIARMTAGSRNDTTKSTRASTRYGIRTASAADGGHWKTEANTIASTVNPRMYFCEFFLDPITTGAGFLMSARQANATGSFFNIVIGADRQTITFRYDNTGDAAQNAIEGAAPSSLLGKWHTLACVWHPAGATGIYVDGCEVATGTAVGSTLWHQYSQVYFGGSVFGTPSSPCAAWIRNFIVLDRSVPPAEAKEWTRNPRQIYAPSTYGRYFLPAGAPGSAVNLDPDDSRVAVRSEQGALTQTHLLTVADSAITVRIDTAALTETEHLHPAESVVMVTSGTAVLEQTHVLTPAESVIVVAAEPAAVVQTHELHPADSAVVVTVEAADLSSVVTVVGLGSAVLVTTDASALMQSHLLAPADSSIRLTTPEGTLGQVHKVSVQNSVVTVTAEAAGLSAVLTLDPRDSVVHVRSGSTILAQTHQVAALDAVVPVRSASGALTQTHTLTPADARVAVRTGEVIFLADVRARVARPQVRVGPDGRRVDLIDNRRVIHG